MSHLSLLGQTTDVANMNNVIHIASVLKACKFLGVSAGMHDSGLNEASKTWLQSYGVELRSTPLSECEVLLRSFGLGAFPVRPSPPRPVVIDMTLFASWLPGDQDYGLAFYDGDSLASTVSVDIISPLPQEIGPVFRTISNRKVVVFLGTDPLSRAQLIANEISTGPTGPFPRVVGYAESFNDGNIQVHPVSLPSGQELGDKVIVVFSLNNNQTVTWPLGWTELFNAASGGNIRVAAAYWVADGMSPSKVIVQTSGNAVTAHVSLLVRGGGTPVASSTASGNSVNPDSPSFSPGSTARYLWLACCGYNATGQVVSAYPTNYSVGPQVVSQSSAASMAVRELESSSEDPGVFTITQARPWIAATIAIPPLEPPFTASVLSFLGPYNFWNELATADVAVCSPGIPHLTSSALGLSTIIVANSTQEDANFQVLMTHGYTGGDYLGSLLSLTDRQVGDAARALVNNSTRKQALSAQGLIARRKTGVRRIAEWIVRDLIGSTAKQSPLFSFPVWPNRGPIPNPGGF